MPHLTIEYSGNVGNDLDRLGLLRKLNAALAELETFRLGEIKSRFRRVDEFLVGDGTEVDAFVHLRVEILSGREPSVKKRAGELLLQGLREAFAGSNSGRGVAC